MTAPGPQHSGRARHAAVAPGATRARHARGRSRAPWILGGTVAAALLVAASAALTATASPGVRPAASPALARQAPPALVSTPSPAYAVPVCDLPGVAAALQRGDDPAVITAMGGAEALRAAVVAGTAPCIDQHDPARLWMVVDKTRPYDPIDFVPASLRKVAGIRVLNAGILRADAGSALARMVGAASKAGAGAIAITSGYRSYSNQVAQYRSQVSSKGRSGADEVSARPGFSEHQSGLAADVVACDGGCSDILAFGRSRQGRWLTANAWRYGFVVRYEKGRTDVTGYAAEPWHVRYVGVALAKVYHDGGFHTLEEFWGLPASPDYAD